MNFSQILALPVVLCFLSSAQQVTAQDGEIIPLWPDGAPGFEDRKNGWLLGICFWGGALGGAVEGIGEGR